MPGRNKKRKAFEERLPRRDRFIYDMYLAQRAAVNRELIFEKNGALAMERATAE